MTRLQVELHPEALEEARAARQWYDERDPRVGDAFMSELDTAVERICAQPEAWPPFEGETRRYLMHRFPYFVVYRRLSDRLQVVAICHGRRRPGYWRDRIETQR